MKIQKVKVKGYKAFHKDYSFDIKGKNVFIYGENGSGKSSFYYALKDFFQSSIEKIDFDELENIFLTKKQKGKSYVKVTFKPDKDGNNTDKEYHLNNSSKNTFETGDTSIRDAVKLKSFFTYKHLLGIHYIDKNEKIDLFELLVERVLKHFKSVAITGDIELGELWSNVKSAVEKPLDGRRYNRTQKDRDVKQAIGDFNKAFKQLFDENNPEYILAHAQPILDQFGHNIKIDLNYTQAVPNSKLDGVKRNNVRIKIMYLGKEVEKPHLFLNEARLSAIAISIYLGMIRRHIQGIPCKVLFLDDIFIGLDIGNRLPLFKILENEFADYQTFVTTYDKPWYEFMKFYLDGNSDWKCFEFYSRRARKGFEIPVVKEQIDSSHIQNFIDNGERYFNEGDNKAAGVYLRSAFEFILKKYCRKKIPVLFRLSTSKLNTEHFWIALVKHEDEKDPSQRKLTEVTKNSINNLRNLVLNPLSHHDVNKHEITAEIQSAINTIKTLKMELCV
jgi:recombinational DNA repair ATPase RecF